MRRLRQQSSPPGRAGVGDVTASVERGRLGRWRDSVETELRAAGGADLLCDARREAEWYASLYFFWDGRGDEPLDRLRARIDILSMRLTKATEDGQH